MPPYLINYTDSLGGGGGIDSRERERVDNGLFITLVPKVLS